MKSLLDFPEEILLDIINRLSHEELAVLRLVCRYLKELSDSEYIWIRRCRSLDFLFQPPADSEHSILENILHCDRTISRKQIYITSRRWKCGRYHPRNIISFYKRQIPQLQVSRDRLLFVADDSVLEQTLPHYREPVHILRGSAGVDLTTLSVSRDLISAGDDEGALLLAPADKSKNFVRHPHWERSPIRCVSVCHNFVATGSKNTGVQLGEIETLYRVRRAAHLQHDNSRSTTWSIHLHPSLSRIISSSSGKSEVSLKLWDVETSSFMSLELPNRDRQPPVYHARFDSENTILTGGGDAATRLWDIRTQTCVQEWNETFDSAVYCFVVDGANTLLTGTSRHAMVRLWDRRRSDTHVQIYFVEDSSQSPVYSLVANSEMFVAGLDKSIRTLDFWRCGAACPARDFSYFK